jgi:flagellar hook assembly protein FlgD/flagellar motor protein MotB
MKRAVKALTFGLMFAFIVASCATKPPAAPESGTAAPSSIQAESSGFESGGDARFQKINFAMEYGTVDAMRTWIVRISGKNGVVYSMDGEAGTRPETLSWDGKDKSGSYVPEGTYSASLEVDYGKDFPPGKAESKPFLFVTTAPSAAFSPNPAILSYVEGGKISPLQILVTAKPGLAKIAGWSIDIYDASGSLFKSITGTGATGKAQWDGMGDKGAPIAVGTNYPATLTVTDEYGGKGLFKGSFSVSDKPSAPAVSLAPRRGGFSPTSASVKNTIDIMLSIPAKDFVSSWKAEITSATQGLIKTYSGDGGNVPDFIRWDGKDEQGTIAGQGAYYTVLSLSYGNKYKESVTRGPGFSLVLDPPSGSITVDPPAPVLADLGPRTPIHFTIQAKSSYAQIAKWTMSVLDKNGVALSLFQANWPNNKVDWDGKTLDGGAMQAGTSYDAVAKVEDEYGNIGTLKGTITTDPLKPADEPSSITAVYSGFAPQGDGSRSTMEFLVDAGDLSAIASWKVEIRNATGSTVKSILGADANVPASLIWDGKSADGNLVSDGTYTAVLNLDYGLKFSKVSVESKPFVVDISPPSVSISLSNDLLSPDGDGQLETATISLDAVPRQAKIVGWSVTIMDPESSPFISFKGSWPAAPISWDGKGSDGSLVESASDYGIVAKVRDEFGNVGEARSSIGTDILVIKTDNGYRISISSIVFKAFTADWKDVPADRAKRNLATLDLLSTKLAKFPDYKIKLAGHAVMVNWDNKSKGEAEQKAILIPLSKSRAEAVAAALVQRGIAADRFETVGLGAEDPVVPNSDYLNRWKNRRVDFFLLK